MIKNLYIILFFLVAIIYARDDLNKQLQGNRNQLDRVKQEIENLRKEIARTDIKASSTLSALDRAIPMTRQWSRRRRNSPSIRRIALRQRQRHSSGPDTKLQGPSIARKLREKI